LLLLLVSSFLFFVSLLLGETLSPSGFFGNGGCTTCFSFGKSECFLLLAFTLALTLEMRS
jgi:hypothetical protein